MTDREKLIELVKRAITDWEHGDVSEKIADHLIANGVVVREKGEWIDRTKDIRGLLDYRFDCSVCEHIFWHSSAQDFDFCPNCGADMTGGDRNV